MLPRSLYPISAIAVICLAAGAAWLFGAQSGAGKPGAAPTPVFTLSTGQGTPTPTPAFLDSNKSFVRPKVLKRVDVSYPVLANLNRLEGVVRIRFTVDETGHVTDLDVMRRGESLLLDNVVLDPRLAQWTFQPATLDGRPVPATFEQEFEFRLDPAEQKALAAKRLARPIGTPDPPYPKAAEAAKLKGDCTIMVQWSKEGLVDRILVSRSTNSPLLDETAARFAYENWRIDPAQITKEPFVKTVHFEPAQPTPALLP